MKALILTDESQDYMADFLADGLCSLFGPSEVLEFPEKPSLHNGEQLAFDCDLEWPRSEAHEWPIERLADALRKREFEMIVVPTLRGRMPAILDIWRDCGFLRLNRDRIIAIDGEDDVVDRRSVYFGLLGEVVPFFKREAPADSGMTPLPFGYPERRIVPVNHAARHLDVGYAVHIWPWAVGGAREVLGRELDHALPHRCWIQLSRDGDGKDRLRPNQYHEMLRDCRIAVVPRGAGYFTNRLFEAVADGCALVAESPSVAFPNAFREGIECMYWRSVPEALDCVRALLEAGCDTIAHMAVAGQAWLREHHTTRVRAETLWGAVHG